VASSFDHLWRQILRCPTERVTVLCVLVDQGCKSKISKLDVAVSTHQDVFRLEVSVDDPCFMQVINCQKDLGNIKPGLRLREAFLFLQVVVELAPSENKQNLLHVFHDEVDPAVVLEDKVHADQEVVRVLEQDFFF